MTNSIEFPSRENAEAPSAREDAAIREARRESEQHYPLINSDESQFENTGGEYLGYVAGEQRTHKFQDFRVDRRAYYDVNKRALIEAFITTEGVNADGGSELNGPGDIVGFSLMIVLQSRDG
jgi:hypothetical protein